MTDSDEKTRSVSMDEAMESLVWPGARERIAKHRAEIHCCVTCGKLIPRENWLEDHHVAIAKTWAYFCDRDCANARTR